MSLFQEAILDNPIVVKHVRSRLRRDQVVAPVLGTVLLCALLTSIGMWRGVLGTPTLFYWFLVGQAAILFLSGTSQVATVVAHAKDSGIIDFHRISPVRPWALLTGFILGGAVREWLCYACTLPFVLLSAAVGAVSLPGLLMIVVDTIAVALLYHTMAALMGLVSPKPRNVAGGILGIVFAFHSILLSIPLVSPISAPAVPTILPTLAQAMEWGPMMPGLARPTFFGMTLPGFFLSLLHQLPFLFFAFVAAERKMRSDRAYLYSKPGVLWFYAVIAFLLLGDAAAILERTWGLPFALAPVVVTYGLAAAGVFLITAVTPSAGDFANGVLRARKQGMAAAPAWGDLAPNWLPAAGFCIILLATSSLSATLAGQGGWSGPIIGASFVGALVVYYFSCARQAFDLMFRKNGASYLAMLLLAVWILPVMLGGMGMAFGLDRVFAFTVMGLSPIFGIGLVAWSGQGGEVIPGAGMAVSSSVLFSIAFTQLRLQAERRARDAALKMRDV